MAQAFRSTRVVTPRTMTPATIVVEQERIVALRAWDDVPERASLTDFGDRVVLPGLVDTHVHINEPGRTEWEGFVTATHAAAAGGVTTLVDMPLNCEPEITNVLALQGKRAVAAGQTWVDWAAWGGVVRGNTDELAPLIAEGVPGFKCFLIHSGIDGFAWVDESDLSAALKRLSGTGLPLLAHAETPNPIQAATEELNASGADWRKYSTFLRSRPDEAEVEAIALLIRLAEDYETPVHIVHLATAEALPMLAAARQRGVPITVETCAHYLWFSSEEIPYGAMEYKCAPPIRSNANREELWRALVEGQIDMVTTDHSPCPPAMKCPGLDARWDLAWGGISSLGLALPVLWTAMTQRGLATAAGLEKLAEWLAGAPARLAGMTGCKGSLEVGADADFTVFDPDAEWVVQSSDLQFRHKISPYVGASLRGRVLETWLRGAKVFDRTGFAKEARGKEWLRA